MSVNIYKLNFYMPKGIEDKGETIFVSSFAAEGGGD